MPFCDTSSEVSLHYITNTPSGDASDLNNEKPTIILLPPIFQDVTWVREQFGDARLSSRYNLVALDLRNLGQSKAPLSPKRDAWVDGADVAVAHEVLQLPPSHVFATGMTSSVTALCFAALFPAKCLSLFLCAAPTQNGDDQDWIVQDYYDLLDLWCFPPDLESFQRACTIMVGYTFNDQATLELQDELVDWWQTHLAPTNSSVFLSQALRGFNRPRFSDKELQSIKVPTVFVQGDRALTNPPQNARRVADQIVNSRFIVVEGGPECLTVVPEYASVVNRVYTQFLGSLPHPPAFQPSQPDSESVCRAGLARLADFMDEPKVAHRDPTDTLSFSRMTPGALQKDTEYFQRCAEAEKDAVNPLNERGEPILKFSERHKDQWEAEAFEKLKHRMDADVDIVMVESSTVSEPESHGINVREYSGH